MRECIDAPVRLSFRHKMPPQSKSAANVPISACPLDCCPGRASTAGESVFSSQQQPPSNGRVHPSKPHTPDSAPICCSCVLLLCSALPTSVKPRALCAPSKSSATHRVRYSQGAHPATVTEDRTDVRVGRQGSRPAADATRPSAWHGKSVCGDSPGWAGGTQLCHQPTHRTRSQPTPQPSRTARQPEVPKPAINRTSGDDMVHNLVTPCCTM